MSTIDIITASAGSGKTYRLAQALGDAIREGGACVCFECAVPVLAARAQRSHAATGAAMAGATVVSCLPLTPTIPHTSEILSRSHLLADRCTVLDTDPFTGQRSWLERASSGALALIIAV